MHQFVTVSNKLLLGPTLVNMSQNSCEKNNEYIRVSNLFLNIKINYCSEHLLLYEIIKVQVHIRKLIKKCKEWLFIIETNTIVQIQYM